MSNVPFSFRVRFGRCEIEVSGSREEVLHTIKKLPSLVECVVEAFGSLGDEAGSAATEEKASASSGLYPVISGSANCSEAVLRLLESDWGRQAPRTLSELVEALRANAVHYPASTLSGVLAWLVRRGRVKRWRTERGYVYVFGEPCVRPLYLRGRGEVAKHG